MTAYSPGSVAFLLIETKELRTMPETGFESSRISFCFPVLSIETKELRTMPETGFESSRISFCFPVLSIETKELRTMPETGFEHFVLFSRFVDRDEGVANCAGNWLRAFRFVFLFCFAFACWLVVFFFFLVGGGGGEEGVGQSGPFSQNQPYNTKS